MNKSKERDNYPPARGPEARSKRAAPLSRMTDWAQNWIGAVLRPGDTALDLTAGNGHDTAFLYRMVGATGRVIAFDIQQEALQRTGERLHGQKFSCVTALSEGPPLSGTGVYLVADCHSRLERYVSGPVMALMANLGYCPGGDRSLTTRPDTSCAALRKALERLLPGGRASVIVYPGHAGGAEEAATVRALFCTLKAEEWQVMELTAINRREAPLVLLAGRQGG